MQDDLQLLENADRVSIFLICVQSRHGELSGSIANFYIEEPVEFFGILDLVLKLDVLCTRLGRPMGTDPRFLSKQMRKTFEARELNESLIPIKYNPFIQNRDRFIPFAINARETMVIEIFERQFSSLQGRIKGKCSQEKSTSFRSALELMRMLREYENVR